MISDTPIYLCSDFSRVSDRLLKHLRAGRQSGGKVAFVTLASAPGEYNEAHERARHHWKQAGCELLECSHPGQLASPDELLAVYVAGGNTFLLLQEMLRFGLHNSILELLRRGVPYIGESAGALVLGPTIEQIRFFDPPERAPELKSSLALGWVPFIPFPHVGHPDLPDRYLEVWKEVCQTQSPFIILRDDDLVVVEGRYRSDL